jgi:RimJ/RimL family protein N-acetyltransferase
MIVGSQVVLRPIEPPDLPFLVELGNHPVVVGNVVGWDFPLAGHRQRSWLDTIDADSSSYRLLVASIETGEPLGLTGLWEIDWRNGSAMSALKLHPDRAAPGCGSDTILTVAAWAFYVVGLRRLWATILAYNARSYGAYVRKCGFRVEGIEREAVFRKGEWCDLYRVASLRADFDRHPVASEYIERVAPVDLTQVVNEID